MSFGQLQRKSLIIKQYYNITLMCIKYALGKTTKWTECIEKSLNYTDCIVVKNSWTTKNECNFVIL